MADEAQGKAIMGRQWLDRVSKVSVEVGALPWSLKRVGEEIRCSQEKVRPWDLVYLSVPR